MTTVQEIVVRATPEGVSKTEEELDELEDSTSKTADEVDDSTGKLGGLAKKFRGAMVAITTGLAIGVGALLTQVPVVRELFGGLGMVLDAVIFQLDERLRPILQPITDGFMDLADAIFEGDYEGAEDAIADLTSELLGLVNDVDWAGLITDMQDFAGETLGTLADAFIDFADEVTPGEIEDAIETLIDLYITQFSNLLEDVDWVDLAVALITLFGKAVIASANVIQNRVIDPLIEEITDGVSDLVSDAIEFGNEFVSNLWSGISDRATEFFSDLREFGSDIIEAVINGIKSSISGLRNILSDVDLGGGVTVGDVAGSVSGGSSGGGDSGGFIGSVGGGSPSINIDGRSLDDNQGRFRKDSLTRRGG